MCVLHLQLNDEDTVVNTVTALFKCSLQEVIKYRVIQQSVYRVLVFLEINNQLI